MVTSSNSLLPRPWRMPHMNWSISRPSRSAGLLENENYTIAWPQLDNLKWIIAVWKSKFEPWVQLTHHRRNKILNILEKCSLASWKMTWNCSCCSLNGQYSGMCGETSFMGQTSAGKQPSIPLINLGRKWTLNRWWWFISQKVLTGILRCRHQASSHFRSSSWAHKI